MITVPTKWRTLFRCSKRPEQQDLPSVTEQTPWRCALYDFGKATEGNIAYFNPTLYERADGAWLITRRSKPWSGFTYGFNDLMAFKLDGNTPQYGIPVHIPSMLNGEHFEDPRVVSGSKFLMLSMTNFIVFNGGRQWTGAHQILCEIDERWMGKKRFDPVFEGNGPTVSSNRVNQKNWLWFMHDSAPHLIYWTQPHTVVRFKGNLEMQEKYVTKETNPEWNFGEPRGGTPPVLIGDEYWTFFHSSLPWKGMGKLRHYHMGAYAFESKPPFRIMRMTSKPILSGSKRDPWADGKPLVVFPCGALLKDGRWTVSLGVNDLCSAWIEIPHEKLERLLKPSSIHEPPSPKPQPQDEAIFI